LWSSLNVKATPTNGLDQDRFIDVGQIRAVDHRRVLDLVGVLERNTRGVFARRQLTLSQETLARTLINTRFLGRSVSFIHNGWRSPPVGRFQETRGSREQGAGNRE